MIPPARVLAATALLVVAGCGHGGQDYGGISHYRPPAPTTRIESWHDLQVEVPLHWRLGSLGCREPASPYVARPSPNCRSSAPRRPTRPAVWFASPLPLGTSRAHGLTVHTVERAGVRLTVATRTAQQARAILATAHAFRRDDNGCTRRPAPAGIYPDKGLGEVYRFSACVYAGERGPLLWSGELAPKAGSRFVAAVRAGRHLHRIGFSAAADPVVVLVVTADQEFGTFPATVYFVVKQHPARVFGGPKLATVALDHAIRAPWDVPGVRRYAGLGAAS